MISTDKYISSAVAESHDDRMRFEDLAKSQWSLINSLELEYKGKTVFGTNCKFEEDLWFDGDGKSDNRSLTWSRRVTCSKALTVLLKIAFFELVITKRIKIGTLLRRLTSLKSVIHLIESKNLLSGGVGDYLLGLNNLTDEDLLVMVDSLFVSSCTENELIQDSYNLTSFLSMANHIAKSVPVFEVRACLPWQRAGIQINSWIKRRSADMKLAFRIPEGFAPLPPETALPLIERSLSLIIDRGDNFISLSKTLSILDNLAGYNQRGETKALQALKKHAPLLGDLIAPPENNGNAEKVITAVTIWIRKLLYLARGACVNIILLTTGLRNTDIRGLQVDACHPSGRVDMLFYLRADIKKTKNVVILPVPDQTNAAVNLLERIKFTKSPYLIDGAKYQSGQVRADTCDRFMAATGGTNVKDSEARARVVKGDSLNDMVRHFAQHFNIPFTDPSTGEAYSLHCYRTTVAGWIGTASNLSILMVRRLFGHSNDVMPSTYLRNNPAFVAERKSEKERAAEKTARQMALAASKGKLDGNKGVQLERGFKEHVSRLEIDKKKSHSLTDTELVISFADLIKQRILNESVCGFMTPFGVRCMRNPADTSQPPCAKRSHRDKSKDLNKFLLKHLSDIDPQNCIGTSCNEAMIGPWSESIKESLLWYAQLLRHQLDDQFTDDQFTDEHFREHAVQFIRQYGPPIKKVFDIDVRPNGSVANRESDREER